MIHLPNVFEIMKGSNAAIAECVAIFSGILCSEVLIFLQSSLEKTSSFQFIIFILEGLPNDVKEIGDANWFQKDFFSHAKQVASSFDFVHKKLREITSLLHTKFFEN